MSYDSSIFSLLNLVECVDEITTSAVARRVGKCEMSSWNREIMIRIEGLLKHASHEYAKLMNDCRRINRMPPEILLLIFSFVGRGKSVVTISHVCKWWRQLTISSPTLWTFYSTKRFPYLDIVLQRSKNALLDVQSGGWDHVAIKGLSLLRSQICRLRTFDVTFTDSQYSSSAVASFVDIFPSPALHLTGLSLSYAKSGRDDWFSTDTANLFTSLFGGTMPRLQILRLNGIHIWPQSCGPTLQCLVLMNTTLPILSLLSVLQTLPCLKVLVLASISLKGARSLPECVVMAACLRILQIEMAVRGEDDFFLLHYFLRVSSLATQAGVALHLDLSDGTERFRTQEKKQLDAERLGNFGNYSIDGMHSLCLDQKITVSDNRSFVTYALDFFEKDFKIIPDGGILFGRFYCSLATVTHLMLDTDGTAAYLKYDLDWREIWALVPSLESLVVRLSADVRHLNTEVLNSLLEADPITGVPRYALRLAKITVIPRWGLMSFIQELIMLLSTRWASGYPVKQVTIVTFPVPTEDSDSEQIKKFVPEVITKRYNRLEYDSMFELPIPHHLVQAQPDNICSGYFDF